MKREKFKSKYPFRCIYRYIPLRYLKLKNFQLKQRQIVEDFKMGIIEDDVKRRILKEIKLIIQDNENDWVIMFVPANLIEAHDVRYNKLADYLKENVDCQVYKLAIMQKGETEPIHLGGSKNIEYQFLFHPDVIKNKNVLLYDDVITTGRTLRTIGDLLMSKGARKVFGLMLSMTIHPNLPVKRYNNKKYKYRRSALFTE